ncbi:hypothetical protein ROHU_002792 [Labeo rohita]|uniref:Uncharacterized protein n=1 Tax=Labeo rohita TaxID=84645 RepID=A0A498NZ65_LABRO|nr:hypothetical protein ROHU_002792 [Labeo rohita]
MEERLLREQSLLRQGGNTEEAPAGADTTAAVWKYREGFCGGSGKTEKTPAAADAAVAVWECRKGSCGSGHCCGSVGVEKRLLREQALLGQWGNAERAPAVARCCWDGWSGDEPLWVVLVVSKGVAMVGLKFE